jgi:hypothetical protein
LNLDFFDSTSRTWTRTDFDTLGIQRTNASSSTDHSPPRMAESSQLVDALAPDTRVWFPDKDKGWKAGHVTSKRVDGDNVQIDFVDENGKVSPSLSRSSAAAKWGADHHLRRENGVNAL